MTRRNEAPAAAYERSRLEPLLSIGEVAALLGISRATVYALMQRGHLAPIRIGERSRFDPEDVRGYIERNRAVVVP